MQNENRAKATLDICPANTLPQRFRDFVKALSWGLEGQVFAVHRSLSRCVSCVLGLIYARDEGKANLDE
jgi:hypothetical protein